MNLQRWQIAVLVVVVIVAGLSFNFSRNLNGQSITSGACPLTNCAFFDTFDAPAGIGNRSGQLNGTVWGVSRAGGTQYSWAPTQLDACGQTVTVQPEQDVQICNGRIAEASNDNGTVTSLAMYPKQPFDFAGRTGKIVFDVSNDTQGSHSAWPELWITDKPVPDPFTHEVTWAAYPQNGIGIRFAGFSGSNGKGSSCPEGSPAYVGVDSAVIVRNYVGSDSFISGSPFVQGLDCVRASSGFGNMNHYEIDISQTQVDVYGTDAGTTTPLKHLATIPNANLSFTRGLMWLEDVHYNADKFCSASPCQAQHSFAWDNAGFDGPVLPRDLAFDALDAMTPNGDGTFNLGWQIDPSSSHTVTVPNVSGVNNASAALLTFNFYNKVAPLTLHYAINGHVHDLAWPYPDTATYTTRTLAIPLSLAEIQPGTNTVSFSTDASYSLEVSNVDLVMVGAGGVPTCIDPSNCNATSTPTPSATATVTQTATATATPSPTATPVLSVSCTTSLSGATGVLSGTCTGVLANDTCAWAYPRATGVITGSCH